MRQSGMHNKWKLCRVSSKIKHVPSLDVRRLVQQLRQIICDCGFADNEFGASPLHPVHRFSRALGGERDDRDGLVAASAFSPAMAPQTASQPARSTIASNGFSESTHD